MRRTTLVLRLLVPAVLIGLVGLLAALEYRWLDQVSDADRDRRRASLQRHADEFADAFDGELTRLTVLLRGAQDGDAAFTRRYEAWHEQSRDPQIVRAIYVARGGEGDPKLSVYDTATRKFTPTAWPDALTPVLNKMRHAGEPAGSIGLSIALPRDTVDAAIPAVMIPLLPPRPQAAAGTVAAIPANPPPTSRTINDNAMARASLMLQNTYAFTTSSDSMIAWLDRPYIESTFVPALAQRYFPTRDDDSYRVAVMDVRDPKSPRIVSTWPAGTTVDPKQADATVPIFSLRPDLNTAFYQRVLSTPSGSATNTVAAAAGPKATAPVPTPAGGRRGSGGTLSGSPLPPVDVTSDRVTARGVGGGAAGFASSSTFQIVVETKGAAAAVSPVMLARSTAPWQLVLQHSSGSLEAAVSSARRRNLWLSFGLLSVLAAGVVLIVSNAQRSERLATQQMDFVATVSHELRTPIAVIRSAAQNLSAGVVEDPARAKQYGELIEAEGRRLTEMVEQVLDYAGISGSPRPGSGRLVDLGAVAADVLAGCRTLAAASTLEIESDIASPVPPVLANEHAVRSAIQNLVTNAIKYGADGGWLRVDVKSIATRARSEVQVTVSDRGLGIDPADLPHVFEAFYRGRRAIDSQIHGNGLGLSLVKRTIEAHGGRVTVRSEPGAGATFTVVLPAASADLALEHASAEAGPSHA
jgi:signal transduction histidine kinase